MEFPLRRLQMHRFLVFRDSIVYLPLQAERSSQRSTCLPLLRRQLHRETVFSHRFVHQSLRLQSLPKIRARDRQFRAKPHQRAKMYDRAVEVSLLQQYLPQHILRICAPRVISHLALKTRACGGHVSSPHRRQPALVSFRSICIGVLLRGGSYVRADNHD